jgi:hypothetical protein
MLRPRIYILVLVTVALSACTAGGPKPLPSVTPSPTPSRGAKVLVDLAKKELADSDIVHIQALDDSKFIPTPALGEAWVDYRGKEPAVRFEVTNKGEEIAVLKSSGKSALVRSSAAKDWIEAGPKMQATSDFKGLLQVANFYPDPLTGWGFSDKRLAAASFLKIGTEKIGSTAVTHWKLVLPKGDFPKEDPEVFAQGLTDMSSSLELWVDSTGFPVRIMQKLKDFTYMGILVERSKDSAKLTRPKSEDILATP